jgi:pimeloyl-ACP methyl ester carboxylesterase
MITALGRALHAETLKLKRTLALRLTVVAPALVALLGILVQSVSVIRGRGNPAASLWESLAWSSLTLWAVFLLPLLITLQTTLLAGIEHAERQWKHLFALPVPRTTIYVAKWLMIQVLTFLSTLVVFVFIVLSGWSLILWHPALATAGAPPAWSIIGRALQCWLAAGLILSTSLWIALRWPGFTVPLAAGIAGTFFALFAASAQAATYYPWLLPVNVLSGGERQQVALVMGIGGGFLMAILGCIDFVRREEFATPKLSRPALAVCLSMVAGFVGLAVYLDRGALWSSTSSSTVRFITVDKDVQLEVLDWGGSGRPVVLLAGLGDTAHVFDKFAPKLTRDCHVYGITRRGFGASSIPAEGYSADRLGDDVLAVIDALQLDRPVLMGHSIAGEELSSVGSRHPEKVAGLVYLDAAYSYAYYDSARGDFNIDLFALLDKLERLKPGSGLRDPRPVLEELTASLPGFEKVLRQMLQELEALPMPNPANPPATTGARRPMKPGAAAARAIMAGQQKFTAIHTPILAIYALPHDMGSDDPRAAEAEAKDLTDLTGPQAKAFEAGVPSARVVRLPHASHYVFQSHEADVLREIDAFVRGLPPP